MFMTCVALSNPASARSPRCTSNVIHAAHPYGSASLHKLVFHVYDAQFWSDDPSGWNMKTPHALHLIYNVSIDKGDLVDRTLEELKRNKAVTQQMLAEYHKKLPSLFTNVRAGQSITAFYQPNVGITFCHNGNVTGVLSNLALAEPFMGIWLGKDSSEPDMRDALLGKGK